MFENDKVNDIHKSRYIASWLNADGNLYYVEEIDYFRKWLSSMGLTKQEVDEIVFLATNGKLELENSAKKFLEEHC